MQWREVNKEGELLTGLWKKRAKGKERERHVMIQRKNSLFYNRVHISGVFHIDQSALKLDEESISRPLCMLHMV